MTDHDATETDLNPGYAGWQLAKALATAAEHDDPATRKRAGAKTARWRAVLENLLSGRINHGSRKPLRDVPAWATPEVVTGGFASGELMAGGPLRPHEREWLDRLADVPQPRGRRTLNLWFLTDDGLAELGRMLRTGRYRIDVPEEGALLVVCWLAEHDAVGAARELVAELTPHFGRLRFYPVPTDEPHPAGTRVHVQTVRQTVSQLQEIAPHAGILAQREAAEVWAPFQDRLVALWLETLQDDWPCRTCPDDWRSRAETLLNEYKRLRQNHRHCGKPEKEGGHFAQLLNFLKAAVWLPDELTGREVGRIRHVLHCCDAKRGRPDSDTCAAVRRRQRASVAAPLHAEIAQVVLGRLRRHPANAGVADVAPLVEPVQPGEQTTDVPVGSRVPDALARKVERCLHDTVDELVARGLIPSGDVLAEVLPQMTARLRAADIPDADLRRLHTAIDRAFARRRSLLLLDLQSQVRIAELPWVAAVAGFRGADRSGRDAARLALREIVTLALTSFPHAIVPNKLIGEIRTLAKSAGLKLPLVEEVAADIFMGRFSPVFAEAARQTADVVEGTLYARYYAIDCDELRALPDPPKPRRRGHAHAPEPDALARLCAARAGVALGAWRPATNGMVLEQQQILTTQNLAVLTTQLDLAADRHERLDAMASDGFHWICRRLQVQSDRHHARLVAVKSAAYAWRQMVFWLSLLPETQVAEFLRAADAHLADQRAGFAARFRPALEGLRRAADGRSPQGGWRSRGSRRFLGWSDGRHWLLEP